jgi:hypothetical protein
MVAAGEDPAHPGTPLTLAGAPVAVAVRPKEAPVGRHLAERNFYLEPMAPWINSAQIEANGI